MLGAVVETLARPARRANANLHFSRSSSNDSRRQLHDLRSKQGGDLLISLRGADYSLQQSRADSLVRGKIKQKKLRVFRDNQILCGDQMINQLGTDDVFAVLTWLLVHCAA